MLRTVPSLPLHRAFDAALRPRAFPPDAGSLLPGLLAATRTGLPPASDDELTTEDQLHTTTSCLLGARKAEASPVRPAPPGRGRSPAELTRGVFEPACGKSRLILQSQQELSWAGWTPDGAALGS